MKFAELQIRETTGGFAIRLHVQPRARRFEIAGVRNGALKIKVTAPPVDDAANHAIVDFLSRLSSVPKSAVKILSGEKSRDKAVQIGGISAADFLARVTRFTDNSQ
jgi:hypothetical protein